LATALSDAQNIGPLNANGQPDPSGNYALISVGVSITRTMWDEFGPMEAVDPTLNSSWYW